MNKQRKPRPSKKVRKAIQPTMDTPGVVARNEKYIQMMMELQAFLPQVTTDPDTIEGVRKILAILEVPPSSLGALELKDKDASKRATQVLLALKKVWPDIEETEIRQTLKRHMDALQEMAADLGLSRGSPRNMKETLARNFLGLQPQDVRSKGVLKTFMKETGQDLKVLFGADTSKMIQKKSEEGHKALNEAEERKQKRQDDETEQQEAEYNKVNEAHDKALSINERIDKKKERDEIHEEALKENEQRDSATASGTPFTQDVIREKELIHAQALEIEEEAEKQREEMKAQEEKKPKERERVAEKIEAEKENEQDDSVASEILDTVKSIHALLQKEEKKGSEAAGTGKGKTPKQDAGEKEEAIQGIMKTLGYKPNDPEGRKFAEKALEKGTLKPVAPSVATPSDKVIGVEEGHAMALQTNERIDKLAAHETALGINERIDKKKEAERGFVQDKEEAHAMALSVNERIDKKKEAEKGLVRNREVAHAMALTTNAKIDARAAGQVPAEATVEDSPSSQAPAITPTADEPTPEGTSPLASGIAGGVVARGARGILGGARRMLGGVARIGSMGVGASALGTTAVAAGGLYAGWRIGKWANRRLGLQSEGERMNEAANTRLAEASENAERVAREHGHSSFAAMQSANRSRAQLQQQEQSGRGAVEGMERGSIEDRIQEPVVRAPVVPPVVNNYSSPVAPSAQQPGNQTVFIRPVHPSFMRYQERRMSRILFPSGTV